MYKAEGFLNHDTKIRLRCISGGIQCRRKENVMKNKNSYVNPYNGNVSWNGALFLQKGDHSNMPRRTDAYLPGDERGHVNASSLGGNSG